QEQGGDDEHGDAGAAQGAEHSLTLQAAPAQPARPSARALPGCRARARGADGAGGQAWGRRATIIASTARSGATLPSRRVRAVPTASIRRTVCSGSEDAASSRTWAASSVLT